MATIEKKGVFTVKDKSGNIYKLYPVTKADAITSGTLSSDRLPTISAEKGGTGCTTLRDSANALVNALSEGTGNLQDGTYFISQRADGSTNTYHRRSLNALWTWIKEKADSLYATASHNHAASNITSGTLSSDRLPTVSVAKGGTGATTKAEARENLGVVSKYGDTMSGDLNISKSRYPKVILIDNENNATTSDNTSVIDIESGAWIGNLDNSCILGSNVNMDLSGQYRAITVKNKNHESGDVKNALAFLIKDNDTAAEPTWYPIFGRYNKPTGTYTGTAAGDSSSSDTRTITIGGHGSVLRLRQSSTGFALVSNLGAFLVKNGTVTGLSSSDINFSENDNGEMVLTVAKSSTFNVKSRIYSYEVL